LLQHSDIESDQGPGPGYGAQVGATPFPIRLSSTLSAFPSCRLTEQERNVLLNTLKEYEIKDSNDTKTKLEGISNELDLY
jgi:hypothetical protein